MNTTRPMRRLTTILPILALLACVSAASAQNIHWRYSGRQHFPPPGPLSNWCFVKNVQFDLLNYARDYASLHGGLRNSARVFLARRNAYGWRMRFYVPRQRKWVTRGFNMVAVARWQGRRNGYDRLPKRMQNWGVYFRNFNNPYSWRGAYWISGCR